MTTVASFFSAPATGMLAVSQPTQLTGTTAGFSQDVDAVLRASNTLVSAGTPVPAAAPAASLAPVPAVIPVAQITAPAVATPAPGESQVQPPPVMIEEAVTPLSGTAALSDGRASPGFPQFQTRPQAPLATNPTPAQTPPLAAIQPSSVDPASPPPAAPTTPTLAAAREDKPVAPDGGQRPPATEGPCLINTIPAPGGRVPCRVEPDADLRFTEAPAVSEDVTVTTGKPLRKRDAPSIDRPGVKARTTESVLPRAHPMRSMAAVEQQVRLAPAASSASEGPLGHLPAAAIASEPASREQTREEPEGKEALLTSPLNLPEQATTAPLPIGARALHLDVAPPAPDAIADPMTRAVGETAPPRGDGAADTPDPRSAPITAGTPATTFDVRPAVAGDSATPLTEGSFTQSVQAPAAAPEAGKTLPAITAAPRLSAEPAVDARTDQIGRDIGVAIARRIANGGEELSIRLNPGEFGKIEVRMAFDEGGTLRAVVAADRADALDLLRRDTADLNRAMTDAGVRTDQQSFRFDTRAGNGEAQGFWQRQQQQQQQRQQAGDFTDGTKGAVVVQEAAYHPLRTVGRINLMA